MKPQFYENRFLYVLALALIITPFGCGEDPGMYQNEVLTFETPVSSKDIKAEEQGEIDLYENQASDFDIIGLGLNSWGWSPFWVDPFVFPFFPIFDDCCFFDRWFNDDDDHHRRRRKKHHRDDD